MLPRKFATKRTVILQNIVASYRVPIYKALGEFLSSLNILVSRETQPHRSWEVDWKGLPVEVQRSLNLRRTWKHPHGFSESSWVHVPYDTLWRLFRYRLDVVISSEMGARTLQATLYRLLNRKSRLIVRRTLSEYTEKGHGTAREVGCSVWVTPSYAGSCSRNSTRGSWRAPALPFGARLGKLLGPKSLPARDWGVFIRRHAGLLWRVYWMLPYGRLAGSVLQKKLGIRRRDTSRGSSESREAARSKVALLTNIVAPYRLPVYRRMGEGFDLRVFYSGEHENRAAWGAAGSELGDIPVKRSRGFTLRFFKTGSGRFYDYSFVHINPGYLLDLLSLRPRAVVTIQMGFRTVAALLYGTLFRRPVWVWWGGTMHTERGVGRTRRMLRGVIVRWTGRWISYGETSTEYLRSLGVPRERILQIQNCVDERLYQSPTESAVRAEPRLVLLYVGQLIGRKGASELLKVAARLQDEGYVFSLILVGGGPEKEELEALAGRLGLENVHFYPPQPPERMPAFYRSADYVVFPTLEDVWGLVVNEALWSGVPVLSSVYAGSAKELLPERNLFDPKDEDGFTAALRRALEGEIEPTDTSRLKTCSEVGDMIVEDIQRALECR